MARALWWAASLAALTFTLWLWTTWTMSDISMGCAKINETDGDYECTDRIVDVLGTWPILGLGFLLTAPPTVAAFARRRWVSWTAVAILTGLSIIGLSAIDGFWGSLIYALPVAAAGLVAAAIDQTGPSGRWLPDA